MNALLMADRFSRESVTSMIIVALLCTMIPFIFLAYYKSRTKAHISSFFIGMALYVAFAFIAEGLFHMLVFQGLSLSTILDRSSHPVYYAIYGAAVAGIFEEAGKYIGLKTCMKSHPGKQNAFLFGVGHGSFEAIAYGSSLFMGNIIIAFMVNSFGIDGYFEKLGTAGSDIAAQKQAIYDLMAISPIENVAAGTERMLALIFQASLTIFIFLAIHHSKLKSLFPIAILLHIIGYLPTYLAQVGILKNMMLSLGLTGVIIVFTASYAYRMYHQVSDS